MNSAEYQNVVKKQNKKTPQQKQIKKKQYDGLKTQINKQKVRLWNTNLTTKKKTDLYTS